MTKALVSLSTVGSVQFYTHKNTCTHMTRLFLSVSLLPSVFYVHTITLYGTQGPLYVACEPDSAVIVLRSFQEVSCGPVCLLLQLMKRAKKHRIIWRRDWSRGNSGRVRVGRGKMLVEKKGENEILTVEKEENLPWKKSENKDGGEGGIRNGLFGGEQNVEWERERKQKETFRPRQSPEVMSYM